jgi:hypothetical protein
MAFNAVTLGRLFRPSALHTIVIERISDTDDINVRTVRTGKKGKLSYPHILLDTFWHPPFNTVQTEFLIYLDTKTAFNPF